RGAALGPLVEELLAGGHSVLAFPAGPGLSLDLARRLAEHSPRVRERTFLWSVALSPSLRELVCAAAEAPPWVAVVGSWEELEPGGHAFWHSVVERARPVILLCHLPAAPRTRSEEHTSELQSRENLVCRLLLEKKKRSHR